jgi:hypothetical protein
MGRAALLSGIAAPLAATLAAPATVPGGMLEHIATIALPSDGQAFNRDPSDPRLMWSIDRATASRIPAVAPRVAPSPQHKD